MTSLLMSDITRLADTFARQRSAYAASPYPDASTRMAGLRRLRQSLLAHHRALADAVSADFSGRSSNETLMAEVLTTLHGIDHTIRHLRQWMRPSSRPVGWLFWPARNRVEYQPLGVVGIMVPWNYPIQLALLPLVGALSAGNRAVIKLSEFTPATNQVLRVLLADAYAEDEVAVVEGAVELSTRFTELPWDHLFFTGSTAVGRQVMAAAARNLTPVTLELGGKSPVIVAPDVSLEWVADRVAFGKMLNAGQTCIAPDYVLVPKGQEAAFVAAMQTSVARMYPTLRENTDYTAIVNDRQHERLTEWLRDAVAQGAQLDVCNPANETFDGVRKMPLHLLRRVHDSMRVMQDELFGPILPICGYAHIDEALAVIRHRPRPLALYLFTNDRALQQHVLSHTHSGGVAINDTLMHVAQDTLPFGGVGASGMGHYHGHEGFLTFSKAKGVHIKGRLSTGHLVYPPYGRWMHRFIARWLVR